MEKFPFRFDLVSRPALLALGVHSGNADVTLTDDDRFVARFGRWVVDTPLSNIDCVEVTGPYRSYKAIGLRGSWVDQGITFGTSTKGGVCVTFHEPVKNLIRGHEGPPRADGHRCGREGPGGSNRVPKGLAVGTKRVEDCDAGNPGSVRVRRGGTTWAHPRHSEAQYSFSSARIRSISARSSVTP